jgi:hypothetical protein
LWRGTSRYRSDLSPYGPKWKVIAVVDDRRIDYPRSPDAPPLHEPRTPFDDDPQALKAGDLYLLHLQYAFWERNQMKQAWYRSLEWIDGRSTAGAINGTYAITMAPLFPGLTPVPAAWTSGVTMPDERIDLEPSWHLAEMLRLFDQHGIEFFEPLEIWHLPPLRDEFVRRTGRRPKSDRTHIAPLPKRLTRFAERIFKAIGRRVAP